MSELVKWAIESGSGETLVAMIHT